MTPDIKPGFMVVGIDAALDLAIQRNCGFINILYSGPELVNEAFLILRYGNPMPNPLVKNRYTDYPSSYAGIEEDKGFFVDVINQIVISMRNAIDIAIERCVPGATARDIALQYDTIFVHLE